MRIKFLIIASIICFVLQISFSVYYSIKVVDENSRFNNQKDKLQNLLIQQQHLEIESARRQSLSSLVDTSKLMNVSPIKSTINLSP